MSGERSKRTRRLPHHEELIRGAVNHLKKMRPEQVTEKVVSDIILKLVMGDPCHGFVLPPRKVPRPGL